MNTRLGHSIRRWVRVVVLSVVAAILLELILPAARDYLCAASQRYSPELVGVAAWIVAAILFYIAIVLLHVRVGQWRSALRYPPLWLAVPLACVLLATSRKILPGFTSPLLPSGLHPVYPLAFIPIALGVAILLRLLLRGGIDKQLRPNPVKHIGKISRQDVATWISSGERPIRVNDRDLFGRELIANRIAHTVGADGRPLALVGRFGTGKTSIVNLARFELEQLPHTVIVASFDAGSVPNPEDVPRLALNRIIAALDPYIDTIELRTLPTTYQRLVAAEPTGRVARILGRDTSADSIEIVERLTPLLEVLNARLVLVVENLERAGQTFDSRHLARLLWALRQVERASFILALDPDHSDIDVWKICDAVERVPDVVVDQVRTILSAAYEQWLATFSYIDPAQNRETGGKLRLAQTLDARMADDVLRSAGDTPLDAIASLLQTPRALKHFLRRVDRVWANLYGEAELDDIFIISALRHGAEPAFEFLNGAIDVARQQPNDLIPRSKSVREEWDQLIGGMSNGPAVQNLVDLLGIRQLTRSAAIDAASSPQGVHLDHPTDYFSRITSEALASEEPRDQTVLDNIRRWQTNRDESLVHPLVAASEGSGQYALVWEHFSGRHSESELIALTEQVVAAVLKRDGPSAKGDHIAIIALWRRCGKRLMKDKFTQWLQKLMVNAVPVSLNFVNQLYYYWTGKYGIVTDKQKHIVRQVIVQAVLERIRTGEDLVRILATDHPFAVRQLINPTGTETSVEAYSSWSGQLPSVLIDGAINDPDIIIAQLANLAGTAASGHMYVGTVERPVFVNPYEIDRDNMTALLAERVDEALALLAEYAGDNAYALRARDAAQSWLKERRSREPDD